MPSPHPVALDPGGQFALVADLGADRVLVYRFDPATRALRAAGSQALPAGSGPRHLLFDPAGRLVYALEPKTGTLRETQRLPTGGTYPVRFAVSPRGRWLLFAIDRSDNVTVLKMVPTSGRLRDAGPPLALPKPTHIFLYDLR